MNGHRAKEKTEVENFCKWCIIKVGAITNICMPPCGQKFLTGYLSLSDVFNKNKLVER